jgi:hypothetical protein
MKNGGRTFAVVTGISTGIFNLLIGINVLLGAMIMQSFIPYAGLMMAGVLVFVVTAVNFAGACVSRVNRVAGGAMMLPTAALLLLAGAVYVCLPLLPQKLFAEALGAAYTETALRASLGVGILLLIVELASAAAAVVNLAAREKEEPAYTPEDAQADASGKTAETFAQRYAARLNPESKAPGA